jgi:hypothetical protein
MITLGSQEVGFSFHNIDKNIKSNLRIVNSTYMCASIIEIIIIANKRIRNNFELNTFSILPKPLTTRPNLITYK